MARVCIKKKEISLEAFASLLSIDYITSMKISNQVGLLYISIHMLYRYSEPMRVYIVI